MTPDKNNLPPIPPGNDHALIRHCVLQGVIQLGVFTHIEVMHDPGCTSVVEPGEPCDCGPTIYAGIGPVRRIIVEDGQLVEGSSPQ